MAEETKFSLFQRPFSSKQKKKSELTVDMAVDAHQASASSGTAGVPILGSGSGGAAAPATVNDETLRKVEAAKSYIENMYKVQSQNIQGRYQR